MANVLLYTNAAAKMLNKEVNWVSDVIKCSLHSTAYVPAQNSDGYFSAATNEITATGYTAGGTILTGATITITGGGTHIVKVTAANAVWASITAPSAAIRWAVIYDSTPGSAATNPLIGYLDVGSVTPNGAFSVLWDAAGIFATTTP